jgi:N-acetylmuramoyl-L-alanine amidase
MFFLLYLFDNAQAENHILPEVIEDRSVIESQWTMLGHSFTSPVRSFDSGSRVGVLIESPRSSLPVVEVEIIDEQNQSSGWLTVLETWQNNDLHVLMADLPDSSTQGRIRIAELTGISSVAWEITQPINEPRRPENAPPPPNSSSLSGNLLNFGVVPRTAWGARSTNCVTPETNWYRNAIHHTAGTQTYGGSVLGQVQATQAYAMDVDGYCDVPYQFLVGYDGSVWEGRQLIYRSAATGGYDNGIQNNVGNIAITFMGCYDATGCAVGPHITTPELLGWTHALIQELSSEHGYVVNSTTVRGHQEWPGNATACPGSYVMTEIGLMKSQAPPFAGEVSASSFSNGVITAAPNEVVSVWVEVENTGYYNWVPTYTNLGILPRDLNSPYEVSTWYNSYRVATVPSTISSGDVARFEFDVQSPASGTHTLRFELTNEWFTWFSDFPSGGGPQPNDISFVLEVVEPGIEPGSEPAVEPASEPSNESSIDEECIDREDGIWCISDSILGSCIHGQYHETSCVDMGKVCSLEINRCIDVQCANREDETWCDNNNAQICTQGNWKEVVCEPDEICNDGGFCDFVPADSAAQNPSEKVSGKESGCQTVILGPKFLFLFALIGLFRRQK